MAETPTTSLRSRRVPKDPWARLVTIVETAPDPAAVRLPSQLPGWPGTWAWAAAPDLPPVLRTALLDVVHRVVQQLPRLSPGSGETVAVKRGVRNRLEGALPLARWLSQRTDWPAGDATCWRVLLAMPDPVTQTQVVSHPRLPLDLLHAVAVRRLPVGPDGQPSAADRLWGPQLRAATNRAALASSRLLVPAAALSAIVAQLGELSAEHGTLRVAARPFPGLLGDPGLPLAPLLVAQALVERADLRDADLTALLASEAAPEVCEELWTWTPARGRVLRFVVARGDGPEETWAMARVMALGALLRSPTSAGSPAERVAWMAELLNAAEGDYMLRHLTLSETPPDWGLVAEAARTPQGRAGAARLLATAPRALRVQLLAALGRAAPTAGAEAAADAAPPHRPGRRP